MLVIIGGFHNMTFIMLVLSEFLVVSTVLFLFGILGVVLNRKNILIMLMSIELLLLSVNINFIVFSVYLDDISGQIFVLFILTVAGAEVCGLNSCIYKESYTAKFVRLVIRRSINKNIIQLFAFFSYILLSHSSACAK